MFSTIVELSLKAGAMTAIRGASGERRICSKFTALPFLKCKWMAIIDNTPSTVYATMMAMA